MAPGTMYAQPLPTAHQWSLHKLITKRSLRLRRDLYSQGVLRGENWSRTVEISPILDLLVPWATWCNTGIFSDDIIQRGPSGDCSNAFAEYKRGLGLLDPQYANAILNKLMEQDFDAGTLISHCREMIQLGLRSSKIWRWCVDRLAAKMSSKDLAEGGEEGLPPVLLEDVLLNMIQ